MLGPLHNPEKYNNASFEDNQRFVRISRRVPMIGPLELFHFINPLNNWDDMATHRKPCLWDRLNLEHY